MSRNPDIHKARKLRQSANAPEQIAWKILRQLRAEGYPVRRQHPIGGFIVDFAIQKVRLVIEIDGAIHHREDVRLRDAERQRYIESLGWSVFRVDSEKAKSAEVLLGLVWREIERLR